jgi:GTP-binding protein
MDTISGIRNVAIIAHVDHGKTTLVDKIMRACSSASISERAMDRLALEQERGITIMSKVTCVEWKGTRVNVVDTPGHADFGGEVERVMGMVDGVVLVVDATEGPMAQTKFVLMKALKRGLRPIVVLNKVCPPQAR